MINSSSLSADRLLSLLGGTVLHLIESEGDRDLTARQLAVLLICYTRSGRHTVRGLAMMLNVGRPVISRVLDRLVSLGLVGRRTDPADRRSIFVTRTEDGRLFVRQLQQTMAAIAAPR